MQHFKTLSEFAKELPINAPKGFHFLSGTCERHGFSRYMTRETITEFKCGECSIEEASIAIKNDRHEARIKTLLEISGIPERYRSSRFIAHTEGQKQAKATAKLFFDAVIATPNKWNVLALLGEPGTGKTLLASTIGEGIIRGTGLQVRYTTAMGMLSELRASYGKVDQTEDSIIDRFAAYDVLIVDEIDLLRKPETDIPYLSEIINRRYNKSKPIIVVSNRGSDELGHYVGQRIDDRLHENRFLVVCDWPSFRKTAK